MTALPFTERLLHWHLTENNRRMPWKGETDPYRIWLSEIILQQTRVEQGRKYYERFISTYPTITDLAAAPEKEVFKLWEGLGYYSRCRNLIATSKRISETNNGRFPDTYESILALPGIGPYTAAAIASFAFGLPHAVVDGNVQRVIARYFGLHMPGNSAKTLQCFRDIAGALLDTGRPALYNQAIMDFGAVVCTPRQPACSSCVQATECQAFQKGWVEQLPARSPAIFRKTRWFYYFVARLPDGSTWIRQRTGNDIWNGLYEFVLREAGQLIPQENLFDTAEISAAFGAGASRPGQSSPFFRQQLTHQTICAAFITVTLPENALPPPGFVVVSPAELTTYPFPRVISTWLQEPPPAELPFW